MKRKRCRVGRDIGVLLVAGTLGFGAFVAPSGAAAPDDERATFQGELDRDFQDFLGGARRDLREFREGAARDVRRFQEEIDREFTEFLRQQWIETELFLEPAKPEPPKPVAVPVAPPPPAEIPAEEEPVAVPPPPPAPLPAPAPPAAEEEAPAAPVPERPAAPPPQRPPEVSPVVLAVPFLGGELPFRCDPRLREVRFVGPPGREAISGFWDRFSRLAYAELVAQLEAVRGESELNDWGYLCLVRSVSRELFPGRDDEAVLASWFLLAKSGYLARVAYDPRRIHLLIPSAQILYGASYLQLEGVRYYEVFAAEPGAEGGDDRLYTYDGAYPEARRSLDLRLKRLPRGAGPAEERKLRFEWHGQVHALSVRVEPALVEFLRSYPQTVPSVYFGADADPDSGDSLAGALKPLVAGKPNREAVGLLLRFVQTAFAYQTDAEQFGTERWLFVPETLHYPHSDCEDRSILFAWLVRRLLGLEVVGLDFPGHVATAVDFGDEEVPGTFVRYRGRRYVVCDPTYVNADPGMAMPRFKGTRPEVVPIEP